MFNLTKNICHLKNLRLLHTKKITKMKINGQHLNITQIGEGQKTVFLLPGTCGIANIHCGPQLKCLPGMLKGFRFISWDPPGYGKSVPPEREFNTKCFHNDAECAVELLRQLSIDRVSLLGWSAGATTAIITAGKYPNLVEKLVIWGAFVQFDFKDYNIIQAMRNAEKLSQIERESYEKLYGAERFSKLWDQAMNSISDFYSDHNGNVCADEVKKIKVPVFLLNGKKDILTSHKSLAFLLNNLSCYKFFEFPEGKHSIHLTYSDQFNEMVADFLLRDSTQLAKELHRGKNAQ